jgi:hypothetical protein
VVNFGHRLGLGVFISGLVVGFHFGIGRVSGLEYKGVHGCEVRIVLFHNKEPMRS